MLSSTYPWNDKVAIIERSSVELHQHIVIANLGNRRVIVGKLVKAVGLALHGPLLHILGGHDELLGTIRDEIIVIWYAKNSTLSSLVEGVYVVIKLLEACILDVSGQIPTSMTILE